MEKALEKLAEQILSFDEASLASLREKYRLRIEHFDGTKDWEKAVIIYCIINAVSLKNTLFNENVLKRKKEKERETVERPSQSKTGEVSHPSDLPVDMSDGKYGMVGSVDLRRAAVGGPLPTGRQAVPHY